MLALMNDNMVCLGAAGYPRLFASSYFTATGHL